MLRRGQGAWSWRGANQPPHEYKRGTTSRNGTPTLISTSYSNHSKERLSHRGKASTYLMALHCLVNRASIRFRISIAAFANLELQTLLSRYSKMHRCSLSQICLASLENKHKHSNHTLALQGQADARDPLRLWFMLFHRQQRKLGGHTVGAWPIAPQPLQPYHGHG